jgi:hypothetical protein
MQSVDGGGGGRPPAARRARLGRALRSRRDALTAWWRWWLVGADMTLIALMPVLVSGKKGDGLWVGVVGGPPSSCPSIHPSIPHFSSCFSLSHVPAPSKTLKPTLRQVHLSKDATTGAYPYHPAAVNFMVEAAKTAVAAASLAWAGRAGGWWWWGGKRSDDDDDGGATHAHHPGWTAPALASRARRARALAAPATLYALNGYLKFALQAHFSPTAARVLGSLKVVAIALLLRCLTGRRFSTVQVQALALMAAGVAVHGAGRGCVSGGGRTGFSPPAPSTLTPRIAATVAASVAVPSLAAVLAQRGMQADAGSSVQEQTFWLCAFGLAANGAGLAAVQAFGGGAGHTPSSSSSIFAGTASPAIAALVAVSAAQGVLAGVFYKSIDAIAKKLSSVGATALTAVLSAAFLGQAALTPSLGLAALILGIATHQFYVGGAIGGGGGGSGGGGGKGEGGGGLALTASPPGSAALQQQQDDEAARATPVKLRRPLAGMA